MAMSKCHFGGGQNRVHVYRPPPNNVSAVAGSQPPPNEHFGGGLKPLAKCHLAVASIYVPIAMATTFSSGRHITCVLCLLLNLRPKLPSRCVVLGSWSIKSLAAVL